MKRIFIVALCVALAVCALAVPASASTYEERWSSILDYSTVNNTGSNYFAVSSNEPFTFTLPSSTIIRDLDIVVRANRPITSAKAVRQNGLEFTLQVISIGSNLYRLYGDLEAYAFDTLGLKFTFSSGEVLYGEVLQFHYSAQSVDFYNLSASISRIGVLGPNSHSAGSDTTAFSFNEIGDWSIILTVTDWKKVDYVSFAFRFQGISFGNVSAYVGDRSIDVSVQSYNGDPDGLYSSMLTGYCDIFGVDRDGANALTIVISGSCTQVQGSQVWLSWLNGSVVEESPSIFASIWNSIKSGFRSVGEWLSNGFNSVVNAITNAFSGLSDEQAQTNDKIDNITDFESEVTPPSINESLGDLEDAENSLMDSVGDSSQDVDDLTGGALKWVESKLDLFQFGMWFFGLFFDIMFIDMMVRFSLSLGIILVIFSLPISVARNIGKSSKSKGG